jgi:hypothetical protein
MKHKFYFAYDKEKIKKVEIEKCESEEHWKQLQGCGGET